MTDTDIWFKTREMQQTDLGKQMGQLQKDIKQMSKVFILTFVMMLEFVMLLCVARVDGSLSWVDAILVGIGNVFP